MTNRRLFNRGLNCTLIFITGLGLALVLTWLAGTQSFAATSDVGTNVNLPGASRYYVAKTGDGSDGSSWPEAYNKLQDALNVASSGDEIWVATGVYTPGTILTDSFKLVPGVKMYGGFFGSETSLNERDWVANPTILSGDIDGDDQNTNGVVMTTSHIVGDNSYHVVYADGTKSTSIISSTVLDGFSITAGKANGADWPNIFGGGFFCDGSGSGNECSPSLANVIFSGNLAQNDGGAMYNYAQFNGTSSPILTEVAFLGNSATKFNGGAMYNYARDSGTSSPALTNVTFTGNSSGNAGAMINQGGAGGESSPILINVTFSGNFALYRGGAMYNDCGEGGESSPSLTNVTFSGNSAAEDGGAIYNYGVGGTCNLVVRNSILWNNLDSSGTSTISATIVNDEASVNFSHSLVQGTGGSGSWISNPSFVDGGSNIDTNPIFITPVDPSTAPTTTGNLRLQIGSPAINAGKNSFVTVGKDLDGNNRIIGCNVDMGAYESIIDVLCLRIFEPVIFR